MAPAGGQPAGAGDRTMDKATTSPTRFQPEVPPEVPDGHHHLAAVRDDFFFWVACQPDPDNHLGDYIRETAAILAGEHPGVFTDDRDPADYMSKWIPRHLAEPKLRKRYRAECGL